MSWIRRSQVTDQVSRPTSIGAGRSRSSSSTTSRLSIVARRSRGIVLPKDLENKKLGAPTAGSSLRGMAAFCQAQRHRHVQGQHREYCNPGARPNGRGRADRRRAGRLVLPLCRSEGPRRARGRYRPDADGQLRLATLRQRHCGELEIRRREAGSSQVVSECLHQKPQGDNPAIRTRRCNRSSSATIRHARNVELERLRMAIRENILTPEVIADGLGGVDPARLQQSIDQIGLVYSVQGQTEARSCIRRTRFLPPLAERRIH